MSEETEQTSSEKSNNLVIKLLTVLIVLIIWPVIVWIVVAIATLIKALIVWIISLIKGQPKKYVATYVRPDGTTFEMDVDEKTYKEWKNKPAEG